MRFHNYIKEQKRTGKKMERTMVGYNVGYNNISGISEYIKSWLDRYNINYSQNTDPHITVAQIYGKYTKPEIIRTIQKLPANFTMQPKQLKLLYGHNVKKYFITIEMKKNQDYIKAHDMVREKLPEVVTFPGGMKPHISLFTLTDVNLETMELEDKDLYMWREIVERRPKLPKIKLNKVVLFNSKFLPEFLLKK